MSIIINDQQFINLKFQYIETPGLHASKFKFIRNQEEYEKYKSDPNFKELDTGWKTMDWGDYNEINSACLKYKTDENGVTISSMDFVKFRDMKLKACLKQWNLKDDLGKQIPITPAIIDKLYPEVAAELLLGFEKATELS